MIIAAKYSKGHLSSYNVISSTKVPTSIENMFIFNLFEEEKKYVI